MSKIIQLLLLSFIFRLCSADQVVLSPGASFTETLSSEPEIVKVLRVTRHGTTAGFFAFYPGEWTAYNIPDPNAEEELELSALGMGQCWSSGANLAMKFDSFVKDAVQSKSFEMNVGPKKKTLTCGTQFLYGMSQKIPYIGLYSDPLVAEAFEDNGKCFDCSSSSAFPFIKSQLLSPKDNTQDFSEQMIIHPEAFLDLDESCPKAFAFYGGDFDYEVPQEDIEYILELSGYTMDNEKIDLIIDSIPNTYSKHLMHHLPSLNFSEKLLKMAENIMSGEEKRPIIKYISEANSNNWAIVSVFARNILNDIRSKIENESQVILYTVHNNNGIGLLMLLKGLPHENLQEYQVNLAANLDIIVYRDPATGTKFVNVEINGNATEIWECGLDCPFEEFVSLMEAKSQLGGDLSVFCNK